MSGALRRQTAAGLGGYSSVELSLDDPQGCPREMIVREVGDHSRVRKASAGRPVFEAVDLDA